MLIHPIDISRIQDMIQKPISPFITAIYYNDNFLVVDGHHRFVASILSTLPQEWKSYFLGLKMDNIDNKLIEKIVTNDAFIHLYETLMLNTSLDIENQKLTVGDLLIPANIVQIHDPYDNIFDEIRNIAYQTNYKYDKEVLTLEAWYGTLGRYDDVDSYLLWGILLSFCDSKTLNNIKKELKPVYFIYQNSIGGRKYAPIEIENIINRWLGVADIILVECEGWNFTNPATGCIIEKDGKVYEYENENRKYIGEFGEIDINYERVTDFTFENFDIRKLEEN